jgi:hypothetical protein
LISLPAKKNYFCAAQLKPKLKKTRRIIFFASITLLLAFVSCKKEKVNTDADPASPPDVTGPSFSFSRYDANGLLKVKRTFAYWDDPIKGLVETTSKEATAHFKTFPFDSANADAGTVACQTIALAKQSGFNYSSDGNGIGFNDTLGTIWGVTGNNLTGIPAFSFVTLKPMPYYYGVGNNSIPSTISRSTGTKIPLGANLKNADSVFVSLTVDKKSITKMVGGSVPYCEFTNTELSVLLASAGKTALLQVTPINFDVSLQGAKKMYFANQSVYTKFVEVF